MNSAYSNHYCGILMEYSTFSIPSTFIIYTSCKEDLSLFPHLNIQLFMYVQTQRYLFNTVGPILQYHFILSLKIVQTLAVGSLSVISWVPLLWYIFLSTFLLSDTINASNLVYVLSQPPNKFFLVEALVVFIRKW